MSFLIGFMTAIAWKIGDLNSLHFGILLRIFSMCISIVIPYYLGLNKYKLGG